MLSEIALKIATIEIEVLIPFFNITNKSNTTSEKLVIRYKYAAISLLKSSNKLMFCENFSKIVNSSHINNHQSDNLTQNSFYHLISLFKNSYNKSVTYFEAIKREIIKINNSQLGFDTNQLIALHRLETLNNLALKNIKIKSIDSDYKILISPKMN